MREQLAHRENGPTDGSNHKGDLNLHGNAAGAGHGKSQATSPEALNAGAVGRDQWARLLRIGLEHGEIFSKLARAHMGEAAAVDDELSGLATGISSAELRSNSANALKSEDGLVFRPGSALLGQVRIALAAIALAMPPSAT